MLAKDIVPTGVYIIKHRSGQLHMVRVDQVHVATTRQGKERKRYLCTDLHTTKAIVVKSAAKFRYAAFGSSRTGVQSRHTRCPAMPQPSPKSRQEARRRWQAKDD